MHFATKEEEEEMDCEGCAKATCSCKSSGSATDAVSATGTRRRWSDARHPSGGIMLARDPSDPSDPSNPSDLSDVPTLPP
jgi:hypothetical protein